MFSYFYPDDVHQDAWHWRAHYSALDGQPEEFLDEYDHETGKGRGFASIDQSRLVRFELVSQRPHLPNHSLALLKDSRPIFFRRRHARLSDYVLVDDEGNEITPGFPTITVLGWQRTVNGKNVKAVVFFLEDGSSICADDTDAVNWGSDGLTHLTEKTPPAPTAP
jgi:hypothetical protein